MEAGVSTSTVMEGTSISSDDCTNFTELLPLELLVEIFSYVSFEDLIDSVQFVSSRWREASYDPHLWRARDYIPELRETDKQIKEMLRKMPKLRGFIADQRPMHSSVLWTLVENCHDLRVLTLCRYQKLSYKFLKKLVQNCPNIEHFFVPNKVLNEFKKAEVIGRLSKLKSLSGVLLVDPNTSAFLRPIVDACPYLQSVDLMSVVCSYTDLDYLLRKQKEKLHHLGLKLFSKEGKCILPLLNHCKTLDSLHLDSYGSPSIITGFDSLQNLSNLRTLCLIYIEDIKIDCVIKFFDKMAMPQLRELTIAFYQNYEDRLADIIVNNCPKLKELLFVQCANLTDQSLENVYHLQDLQTFHLDTGFITDIGIGYLKKCKGLKNLVLICCERLKESSMKLLIEFENLHSLSLDYCDIKGFPMDLIPSNLKHLNSLSVRCCLNKDREAVKRLLKEMPHLTVRDGMIDDEDGDMTFRCKAASEEDSAILLDDASAFLEMLV